MDFGQLFWLYMDIVVKQSVKVTEIRVSKIRVSEIRVTKIRVSKIRVSEIRISSNHHELHGAISVDLYHFPWFELYQNL